MNTTLLIKDLSTNVEFDRSAMRAVRGGLDNQANAASQLNSQSMLAAANVGIGLVSGGPITVQSDNDFTQYAYNTSYQSNFSGLELLLPVIR